MPAGSVSYGYFWARRPYNVYRWLRADGTLIAHRFDAVTEVRIAGDSVRYRDLALDWWALPDGTLLEEDRDELEGLAASGALMATDVERANEAARQVFSRYRHIIDEVAPERRPELNWDGKGPLWRDVRGRSPATEVEKAGHRLPMSCQRRCQYDLACSGQGTPNSRNLPFFVVGGGVADTWNGPKTGSSSSISRFTIETNVPDRLGLY
ncbi:MAG: DUF402 domain-containing protein [Chloroflexi bacterium]|nr:DUF402 domain-containing protein [Chloroflexota bacterium]